MSINTYWHVFTPAIVDFYGSLLALALSLIHFQCKHAKHDYSVQGVSIFHKEIL